MASTKTASRLFLLALITVLGCVHVYGQSLKLGPSVGALYLVSTESSNGTQDIYTKQKGGFGFGPWAPSVGLEFRYSPPRGHVTLAMDASYSWLQGDGDYSWVAYSGDGSGSGDLKGDLYMVSAGAQWNFLSGPVQPYLGVRALWTYLTGVRGPSSSIPWGGFDHFGVGLLGGATIDLTSSLALDACARYNFTSISDTESVNPPFNEFFIGVGLLFELL